MSLKKILLMIVIAGFYSVSLYCVNSENKTTIKPYSDIPPSHWAYKSIMSLYDEGYIKGISKKKFVFDGKKPVTRYQMAAFLRRVVDQLNKSDKKPLESMSYDSLVKLKELLLEYSDDIGNLKMDVARIDADTVKMKKQMKILGKQVQINSETNEKFKKHSKLSWVNNVVQYLAIAALAYKVY